VKGVIERLLGLRALSGFAHGPWTVRLVWKSSRGNLVLLGLVTLLSALAPIAVAWLGKLLIDAVVSSGTAPTAHEQAAARLDAMFYVWCELTLVLLMSLLDRTAGFLRLSIGRHLASDVTTMVMQKALTLELGDLENPTYYDKLTRARREASTRPMSLVLQHWTIARSAILLIVYCGVLASVHPVALLVLVGASLPSLFSEARFSGMGFRFLNHRVPDDRKLRYLESVLSSISSAKELKLLGFGKRLLDRYGIIASRTIDDELKIAETRATWGFFWFTVGTLALYAGVASFVWYALIGKLTLGQMAFYILSFRQVQQGLQALLNAVGGLYEDNLYIANLIDFMAIVPASKPAARTSAAKAEKGIRFEDVGFQYPDSNQWALRGVSLYIHPGGRLGIAGKNGAGKTTFIKLLAGLYAPSEGRVLLDGRDVRDWPRPALNSRLSVLFQDFSKFHFSLRENVGFGELSLVDDDVKIRAALQNAQAGQLVSTHGLEKILSRQFDGGTNLSGGEWQKIAIARTFLRAGADICVLDEPLAFVDPNAGQNIRQHMLNTGTNRTVILISHHVAALIPMDEIIVLGDGQILERGTHGTLVQAAGAYRGLFEQQLEEWKPARMGTP
jgi:ATP-binding cassette subfamily B protein